MKRLKFIMTWPLLLLKGAWQALLWIGRRWKVVSITTALVLLAGGAGWEAFCWVTGGNDPLQLWATHDTTFTTVAKFYSDGRDHPISIEVQVQSLVGLRLGQPTRVRIKTRSQNSVKISYETIMAGKLQRDPTTWELYDKPTLIFQERNEGFTTRVFEVVAAVWEPPTTIENLPGNTEAPNAPGAECVAQVYATTGAALASSPGAQPVQGPILWPFTMEFLYSSKNMANGLPKWQYQQIPCVNFGFSSTLEPNASENGEDLGPLGDVPKHDLLAGVFMERAGMAFMAMGSIWMVWLFISWVRRQYKLVELPLNAQRFQSGIKEAAYIRDSYTAQELEYFAFLDYLSTLGGDIEVSDATISDAAVVERWRGHRQYEQIAETVRFLDEERRHPGRASAFARTRGRAFMAAFVPSKVRQPKFTILGFLRPIRPSYLFGWNPPVEDDENKRS